MEKRDLVLGAVENYGWETIRPFVDSLRATGFDGEVRLFASNIDGDTVAHLQAAGVELSWPRRLSVEVGGRRIRPYNARLRWPGQGRFPALVERASQLARDPRRARARFVGALSDVFVGRYFWSWLHLSRSPSAYRNVMLTDVRDVLFLRSPFDFEIGDGLSCFLEDERARLGTQPLNRSWLQAAYGSPVVESLSVLPISCAGVTIGTASAVLAYLGVMVDELARLPRQPSGIDQGVHNYAVHTGRVPNVQLLGNEVGPVLTVGIMSSEDAKALVSARVGDAYIVHQYDRHPELWETFEPLLPGGVGDSLHR